jgi:trigger factor
MAEETKDAQTNDEANQQAQETETPSLPEYGVSVEDVGTLKKRITVTVPRERIDAKRDEMFGELSSSAQVPGFRVGRAPRRLVEKRFGKEVSEDVRNALIGESLGQAVEKTELKTIGEPDLDLDAIKLPETGDMEFSFETEVVPEFDLPELKGIKVNKPDVQVTDERISEQLGQWAASQARYQPTDAAAKAGDTVVAGATIAVEGADQPTEVHGLHLRVAPGQIEGIPLLELGDALDGKKAGQTATVKAKVSDAHPNEAWQGKDVTIEIAISQVQERIVPEVNDEFAKQAGFESIEDLRELVRSRGEAQLSRDIQSAMEDQVKQYLLDNTTLDVPEAAAKRHTDRLLQRRLISLLRRGVPRDRIEEQITELKAAAGEQAVRDMKLSFIMDKIAEQRQITVTPEQVNARVAQIASMYNRRPERVKQELGADGTLQQLELDLREEEVARSLLEEAEITTVKPEEKDKGEAAKGEDKDTPKAAAKEAKKTAAPKAKAAEKEAEAKPKAKKSSPAEPKAKEAKEAKKAKKSAKKDDK